MPPGARHRRHRPTARIDLDYAGQTLEAAVDRNRLAILNLSVGDWCAVRFHRVRVFPEPLALPAPSHIRPAPAVAAAPTDGEGSARSTAA